MLGFTKKKIIDLGLSPVKLEMPEFCINCEFEKYEQGSSNKHFPTFLLHFSHDNRKHILGVINFRVQALIKGLQPGATFRLKASVVDSEFGAIEDYNDIIVLKDPEVNPEISIADVYRK
jgi:hypothetical protein